MNKDFLAYKLKEYVSSGILPMHMPGHKRKVPKEIEEMMTDIYEMDLTEVEGTDNLHDATGIIKDRRIRYGLRHMAPFMAHKRTTSSGHHSKTSHSFN